MAASDLTPENLSGPQKAAVFFLAMGEEFTSSFFRDLDEESIKKIGRYMSEINYVSSEVLDEVLDEVLKSAKNDVNLMVSGKKFLEDIVSRTLDKETADEVFKVIGAREHRAPFSELAYIPADTLVNIVKNEHPQTIALILSYLPSGKGAEVLSLLPEDLKADIALRVAGVGEVQEEIVQEIEEAIRSDLSRTRVSGRKFNGIEKLASILNEVDGNTEESVFSRLEEEDSELAGKVRQKMFVFEDLLRVDDKSFREILQSVDNQMLTKALKTSSEEMKQKIFNNLSERAVEMLREDMEVMGPVRLSDVEEAQQEIIKIAKKLESEGRIVLAGKGKDDVFV